MKPLNKEVYARLIALRGVVLFAFTTLNPELVEPDTQPREEQIKVLSQLSRTQSEAIVEGLKELGVWSYASPNEVKFLQGHSLNMDRQRHINAMWRKEAAIILMWALGIRETWPSIDQEVPPEALKGIPLTKIGFFAKLPELRPQKEIETKRALLEAWHWRVRTRQLIEEGQPFPAKQMEKLGFKSFDDIVRFSAKGHLQDGDLSEVIDGDFPFKGKAFRDLTSDEYQEARSIIMERHFALNWLCGMAPGNRWDETPTPT